LIEFTADWNQKSPERDVIRDTRKSDRTQEDRIVITEFCEAIFGHHAPRRFIGFAIPTEVLEVEANSKLSAHCLKDTQPFRNNFIPDSVSRDDCQLELFHR